MRTIACHDGLLYKRATASCVVLWNAVHEVRTVACRACGIARRGNSCCAVVRRRVALDEAGAKTRVALDEAGEVRSRIEQGRGKLLPRKKFSFKDSY